MSNWGKKSSRCEGTCSSVLVCPAAFLVMLTFRVSRRCTVYGYGWAFLCLVRILDSESEADRRYVGSIRSLCVVAPFWT